ncbi:ENV1 protein, partial [Chordeiles acutipennis]|nr:ENV1 protein [Chordeiles acutipennis]
NLLWKLMKESYQLLNSTSPKLTEHCWLCFGIKPPFYEAVGVVGEPELDNKTNPPRCTWEKVTQGITLGQVTGQGTCIG